MRRALYHYAITAGLLMPIMLDYVVSVDSGGQYENGCTTDVTRTFHFGVPEPEQIEMYTRVLMGAIDLVSSTRPYVRTKQSTKKYGPLAVGMVV